MFHYKNSPPSFLCNMISIYFKIQFTIKNCAEVFTIYNSIYMYII